MEKRKTYYAVVNNNGEQVLNALLQKGGQNNFNNKVNDMHNGDIYYIDIYNEIDGYDAGMYETFKKCVLEDEHYKGFDVIRLSDAEVRDIWRKIYIIADGTDETGKRILAELEKRGGVNVGNLACIAFHNAYFIEGNGNKITSCDFPKMLDEWGFTRYELPPLNEEQDNDPANPVLLNDSINAINVTAQATPTAAESAATAAATYKTSRVVVFGKELKIDLTDAVPQGYEAVDERGNPIDNISLKLRPKHYRPKIGEMYYIVTYNDGFCTNNAIWSNDEIDLSNYESGNCFATEEQAQRLAIALIDTFKTTIALIHKDNGK